MLVINMNTHPVSVKINGPQGVDFVHLVKRGRVTLPEGTKVDTNWLAGAANIKVFDTETQPVTKAE